MTSAFDTSGYNVKGSLFAWVVASVATYAPPLVSGAKVVLDNPEEPLVAPVYAVHFIAAREFDSFQGRNVDSALHGGMVTGLMYVEARVSRTSANWRAQLDQMLDSIRKAYQRQTNASVNIMDFYTDADTPAATGYRVTLMNEMPDDVAISLNPSIMGQGIQLTYQYVERA